MNIGKHYYKHWVVTVTGDSKPEDFAYLVKADPEFKEILGIKEDDNSKPKRKPKSDSNDKSE